MPRYAAATTVPVSRSRDELQTLVERVGASDFGYRSGESGTAIMFRRERISYLVRIPNPPDGDRQAERSIWRAFVLLLKAKVIAIEEEITTFEETFLAYTLVGQGVTLAEQYIPGLKEAALEGRAPDALPLL